MTKNEKSGTSKEESNLVITPGGPRAKDRVHPVQPGETVRRNEDGTYSVIPPEQPAKGERRTTMSKDYVLTPGGYRPKSLVQHIEPGNFLRMDGVKLQKIHPSGRVLADFGPIAMRPEKTPLMPLNVIKRPGGLFELAPMPAFGSGWIADASWTNNSGQPVSSFRTTWVVPPAPTSLSGQTIFLFNGIQNSTMIYQPVLQWGPSAAGGGNYWAVASWYADGQGGVAYYSKLIKVNVGDTLIGVMTLTSHSSAGFSYNCEFQGIANSNLAIQNVQELTWCIETLEAYGITKCSDYPNTGDTAFTNIAIQCGSITPTITWSAANIVTDCGQHARVINNSATAGEVDIWYRSETSWHGYESLGGIITSPISTISWAANRIDCFARGTDNAMYHKWWDGAHWGGWENLGGIISGKPTAVSWGPNRIDVFARGTDNAMYHKWWDGAHWGGWENLGGILTSDIAAICWGPNRIDCFARGTDNAMYHRWWDGAHWGGWEDLGGILVGEITAVSWAHDRLDIFGRGTDNAMYHRWWDGAHWGGWENLGGILTSDITAVCWAPNRIDCFGRGTDNAMYHRWWDGAHWGGWENLGGIITSKPTVVSWGNNRLDCFAAGTDNAVYHRWWDGVHWGGWEGLGGIIMSDVSAVCWGANRIDLFVEGTDAAMFHKWWG